MKEYYDKNYKDKIFTQRSKKEKCECGLIVTHYRMNKHKKTKKHIILMEIKNNNQTEILDGKILEFLNGWKIDRLGQCTKIILRIGMWELFNTYTPGHIVINEAVELAQGFSEKDAYKFVNGLLDKAFKLREASVLE